MADPAVLVRFDCGCVGTPPVEGRSLLFDRCDGDGDSLRPWINTRDVSGKTFSPVDVERQKRLIEEIQAEITAARRYHVLRSHIRHLLTDDA